MLFGALTPLVLHFSLCKSLLKSFSSNYNRRKFKLVHRNRPPSHLRCYLVKYLLRLLLLFTKQLNDVIDDFCWLECSLQKVKTSKTSFSDRTLLLLSQLRRHLGGVSLMPAIRAHQATFQCWSMAEDPMIFTKWGVAAILRFMSPSVLLIQTYITSGAESW